MACAALTVQCTAFGAAQAPQRRLRQARCAAAQQAEQLAPSPLGRRSLLAGGMAMLGMAAAAPADAIAPVSRWDGESSAIGSCELGEPGDECRRQILLQDKASFKSYESTSAGRAGKVGATTTGVPVAEMSDEYVRSTVELTDALLVYCSFTDPTDPARIKLVGELKKTMPAWVSKYARGGSARKVSARKVYVVVDALSAHFATNGLGPLPRTKLAKLEADIQGGRELLAQGK